MHRGSSRIVVEDRQPSAEPIQSRRVLQRVVTIRRRRKHTMRRHLSATSDAFSRSPHPASPQSSSYLVCDAMSRSSSQLPEEQR
ncbi:hypothetical protein CORC01_06294 [Colletotrichum orchidophilum]|uniref:Uncharacterized protein n=1 Tax=Colletotrichum orchidophilum TaxID=1209926 RepID=A0A1G4BAS6_9PEZI|nr:uncharacterized protein CORC01_06294 [Colletotrichum orchidophilum]OHE98503.1 hypothetical protein CORC01_06294 [Colletotrichum orchidophilum]